MTTQDQIPQLPCAPCPIEKEITTTIQHYTMLLQNLRLFLGTKLSPIVHEHVWKEIRLVQGFINELYVCYELSQEAIEANRLQVVE